MSSFNFKVLLANAQNYFSTGYPVKALELIDETPFVHGEDKEDLDFLQGSIFDELGKDSSNREVKFTFLLASVECFLRISKFPVYSAEALLNLADEFGLIYYYKKSMVNAKKALNVLESTQFSDDRKHMFYIIDTAESEIEKIAVSETLSKRTPVASPVKICELWESREIRRLKSVWVGLNENFKRDFMKINTSDLKNYVGRGGGRDARDALQKVLTFAKKKQNWTVWVCRTCSKKFSAPEDCKLHLEEAHAADVKPSSRKAMPQRLSKIWADKISVGGWEPVNAIDAVEKIKTLVVFVYDNGWSKDFPLAEHEERSKLLREIKSVLVRFSNHNVFSVSLRDRLMNFAVRQFDKHEVSLQTLIDCQLVKTPQIFCFLECGELNQILDFLRMIKCTRDDGTELVCRAVNSFCNDTGVKEKMDFDSSFSVLLLDKRLLQGKVSHVDGEGKISCFDPNIHYANVHARGDYVLTWLNQFSCDYNGFEFPKPIRTHKLDIWMAALRVVQFTCRRFQSKYAKKLQLIEYDAALTNARDLCGNVEIKNCQGVGNSILAPLLCNICEESNTSNIFLCAVRDIIQGGSSVDLRNPESCMDIIRENTQNSQGEADDAVLKSIECLASVVNEKVALLDSKMLLIENSRISLLEELTRLAFFDYRSYIQRPVKKFMLDALKRDFNPNVQ